MGAEYLKSFASSLNENSKLRVTLINDVCYLENTTIYVCEKNCSFEIINQKIKVSPQQSHNQCHYNPDISQLFSSATKLCPQYKIMAIILTGIGDDGSSGMLDLSKCTNALIAESHESAIVYGMPMRAKELVKNVDVLSLDEIIVAIKKFGA
jgi:two-component system chemotaxis response regulator CheB